MIACVDVVYAGGVIGRQWFEDDDNGPFDVIQESFALRAACPMMPGRFFAVLFIQSRADDDAEE